MSSEVTVETLYRMCEVIDATEDPEKCADEYATILKGVNGNAKVRMLTSQLLIRYMEKFHCQMNDSLSVLYALCLDSDQDVHKYVQKFLPSLVTMGKDTVVPVSSMMTQLMKTMKPNDRPLAEKCLNDLLCSHPEAVATLLQHAVAPDVGDFRITILKFLERRLPALRSKAKLTAETEQVIVGYLSSALTVVDGDEFPIVVSILKMLNVCKKPEAKRQLYEVIINQSQLNLPINTKDTDRLDQILCCLSAAVQFACDEVSTNYAVTMVIEKVLPQTAHAEPANRDVLSQILHVTAELSAYCKNLENAKLCVGIIGGLLMGSIPEEVGGNNITELPDIRITDAEALLVLLFRVGSNTCDLLVEIAPLRRKLTTLSKMMQSYVELLNRTKQDKEKTTEENRLKMMVALKSAQNIILLVRSFKFSGGKLDGPFDLSWKNSMRPVVGVKNATRQNNSTVAAGAAQAQPLRIAGKHPPRELYQPPYGKYSQLVSDWGPAYNTTGGKILGKRRHYDQSAQ